MSLKALIVVAVAVVLGVAIGFVDSRPTWDDTGVTAGAILVSAFALAFVRPGMAWLIGLALGVPVVLFNLAMHGGVGSALAVVFGLGGAAAGNACRRAVMS